MFLLCVKKLCVDTNSPSPMCEGVEDTVFSREVMGAALMEVLVCVGGCLYTEVSNVFFRSWRD